jgi:AraC-like DNA-binding protein
VERLGLHPAAVLRQARLPATLHLDEAAVISTAQLFAVWQAIETLSGDPGFSLKMVRGTSTATHKLAFLAASYARDYRDGLERIARFKRMCSPDQMRFEEDDRAVSITTEWPSGTATEPALSVDASFAMMVELGRRGTGQHLTPIAVEYARTGSSTAVHDAFFGCRVSFGAGRDKLVLKAADLDLSFLGHNAEMLTALTPALVADLADLQARSSVPEQIKRVLKRRMASGRPDVAGVAREIGLSERTLQRRITDCGTTFRALLDSARQELGKSLLLDASVDLEEVAFLLGYEDPNSFYRAFKGWEQMTPGRWRKLAVDSTSSIR